MEKKVKLVCSYGGKIQSRPSDHQLHYLGGDSKILALDRTAKFSDIIAKLYSLSNTDHSTGISVKYQLPGEDLASLVSLIDDEDVEHMMVEYDRMQRIPAKRARLRLFIFDVSDRHVPVLKSGARERVSVNPDYLFGFDKEYQPSIGPPLDLLQIPGIMPPENYGKGNMAAVAPPSQVVYRVPAVIGGGGYLSGQYSYAAAGHALGGGDRQREQPVYNFVPNF